MGNHVMRAGMHFLTVVAVLIACEQAAAKDANMPIMFVGDWCYGMQEGQTTDYTLPSWTEGGICKKILSIRPWDFYTEGWNCSPMQLRENKHCAPSGCSYEASIVALCLPDGPATKRTQKHFKLIRYKGNLQMIQK
jgi:hypothetical protein